LCRHVAPGVFVRDDEDGCSYAARQPETWDDVAGCLEAQWPVADSTTSITMVCSSIGRRFLRTCRGFARSRGLLEMITRHFS
jgi:hypothetical protein